LITICDKEKLNSIGDDKYALSKRWYQKQSDFKQLKDHTYNFFKHIGNTKSELNLWTTFIEYKFKLKGKGYTKGFLACNQRGTNEYRGRESVAYLVNRFINPYVKNFFVKKGIWVDEDGFALSEMLQFIWRSAIRDGKHINIYVPSARMRGLLVGWLNSLKKEAD
jgi:hypothetical protein